MRTFLVHLADVARASPVLDAVRPLVRRGEGHLIGLHVLQPIMLKLGQVMTLDLDGLAKDERRRREEVSAIKRVFDEATVGEPYVAEWRQVEAKDEPSYARAVVGMGRAVDLVVASRASDDDPSVLRALPARLALECGRPVLLIPPGWSGAAAPTSAVVAWNGSREAARAAFDALPLLKAAARVAIVTSRRDEEGEPLPLSGEEIAATLSRHGVHCDVQAVSGRDGDDGAAILERVASLGADLLVMGAYGRGRLMELVLGGVTRTVLGACPVPALLSH